MRHFNALVDMKNNISTNPWFANYLSMSLQNNIFFKITLSCFNALTILFIIEMVLFNVMLQELQSFCSKEV